MPLKIIQGNYWQIIGKGAVLLSSPPATDQAPDLYTGQIVEEAALISRAHALIEKERIGSTDSLDPESAFQDFRSSIERTLEEFEIKCVLEILGQDKPGLEIRAAQIGSGSIELPEIIKAGFEEDFDIRVNSSGPDTLTNGPSKAQTVRLLLGPEERDLKKDLVISKIAVAVGLMSAKLCYSETDQRASNVLD